MVAQAVAVFEQDQGLALQIGRRDSGMAAQVMARRKRGEQFVVGHMDPLKAGHVVGQGDQHDIQHTGLQIGDQPLGHLLAQEQPQPGKADAQDRQGRGQQERRDRGDHPQSQPAFQGLAGAAAGLNQILRLGQNRPRPGDRLGPGGGEDDPGAVAVDHRRPEDLLQLLNPGRQGRLGDVGGLGGAAERAVLGEKLEVLKLPKGREHRHGQWIRRSQVYFPLKKSLSRRQAASNTSGSPQNLATRPFCAPGAPVVTNRRPPPSPGRYSR